jgi:hypothetical protein
MVKEESGNLTDKTTLEQWENTAWIQTLKNPKKANEQIMHLISRKTKTLQCTMFYGLLNDKHLLCE